MSDHTEVNVDLSNATGPPGSHFATIDELRRRHPRAWNASGPGYWVLSLREDIRAAARQPELFTNHSIVAVDPDPAYRFLPTHVDPPEHANYRHALNRWFSPQHIAPRRPDLTRISRRIVEGVLADGGVEFVGGVGDLVTARSFLHVMSLPEGDATFLISCAHRIAAGVNAIGDKDGPVGAMNDIKAYYTEVLADRRKAPRDEHTDFVTYLARAGCGPRPFTDDEILDICMTLTFGSLDTTKSQMGWAMWHLATHDADRRWVVEDPAVVPTAVEEFLRVYPIISMARRLAADVDFDGCPMRQGDMVLLHMQAANRDPEIFEEAATVRLDRTPNPHISFGASPHRCLGSHLARTELQVLLEEWHRAIPDYRVAADAELVAHGGVVGLVDLPLAWAT